MRREPGSATEFGWDPDAGDRGRPRLRRRRRGGEPVRRRHRRPSAAPPSGKSWSCSSRVNPTRTLARALSAHFERTGSAPVLLQASATGLYPTDGSSEPLTEDARGRRLPGSPRWWRSGSGRPHPAIDAGVRVVLLRTSPVIDGSGGLFPVMRRAWSLGAGAKLGDGTQHMPLIQLGDYLRFVIWAAETEEASGPYNLTLPQPTTNGEFTDELAHQLHRPRFLKAPKAILTTVARRLRRAAGGGRLAAATAGGRPGASPSAPPTSPRPSRTPCATEAVRGTRNFHPRMEVPAVPTAGACTFRPWMELLRAGAPRARNFRPWMEIPAAPTREPGNLRPWMEIPAALTRVTPESRPRMEIPAAATSEPATPVRG